MSDLATDRPSTTMQAQMVAPPADDFGDPLPQELESELAELRRLRSEVARLRDQLKECTCRTRSK